MAIKMIVILNEEVDCVQKIIVHVDKDKMISNVYNYLYGEWILSEYFNLAWYPTGEEDDEQLRTDYEEVHTEYLGKSIRFSSDNLMIPAYDDGINVYYDKNDYIYKFSINKILEAPIVEVYGEYIDGVTENIRFIFDGNGCCYIE